MTTSLSETLIRSMQNLPNRTADCGSRAFPETGAQDLLRFHRLHLHGGSIDYPLRSFRRARNAVNARIDELSKTFRHPVILRDEHLKLPREERIHLTGHTLPDSILGAQVNVLRRWRRRFGLFGPHDLDR